MEKHKYIVEKTIGNYKFPATKLAKLFKAGFRMVQLPDKRKPGDKLIVETPFPEKALVCSPEGWVNLVRPL